jgi:hypothetical protein
LRQSGVWNRECKSQARNSEKRMTHGLLPGGFFMLPSA